MTLLYPWQSGHTGAMPCQRAIHNYAEILTDIYGWITLFHYNYFSLMKEMAIFETIGKILLYI